MPESADPDPDPDPDPDIGSTIEPASGFAGDPDGYQRLWTPHRMVYLTGQDKPATAESADCPFCLIPSRTDEDGLIVARGATVYAVLNLYPYNSGHLMAVPYRHVADYTDLTDAEVSELGAFTQRAMRTLRLVSAPHGFNIGMNQGAPAGAGIAAHLHQHVVPRWGGDTNFIPIIAHTRVLPQLLADVRKALAGGLAGLMITRPTGWERVSCGVLNNYRTSISKATAPIGHALVRVGVSADVITIIGTIGSTASALIFFPRGMWFTGAFLVWMFVMLDMVDGAVARASGRSTKFGALLDSSCDRVADAAVFAGIGWYFARHDQPWLLAACLLCLVLGSLTSYIRARAEGLGMTASVGFAERAERLIIVLVGTGVSGSFLHLPYVQAISLWFLVAASTVTVGQRISTVWKQSRQIERTGQTA